MEPGYDESGNFIGIPADYGTSSVPLDYIRTVGQMSGSGSGQYANSGPSPFWSILATGLKSASGILGTRYAVPQLNNGQVIQTGPNGQMYMSQNAGGGIPFGSGGGSSMLLLGGAALLAFLFFSRKNEK